MLELRTISTMSRDKQETPTDEVCAPDSKISGRNPRHCTKSDTGEIAVVLDETLGKCDSGK